MVFLSYLRQDMNGLWNILCVVVVVVLVADLAESGKIRNDVRTGKQERPSELRSLPYQDILRVYGQTQTSRKKPTDHGHHTTTTPAMTTTPRPPQVVCFGDLGCFSDEYPFDNTGGVVPQSPEYINTMFYVFTKSNPTIEARQAISYDDILSVQNSPFDPTKPVKVLIHGFYSYSITGDPFWAGDAMREMLIRDDINVIIVDWNKGAEFPNYAQAATNVRLVAAQVARLITFLVNETGCGLDQFHLVGHSLGAHLSGHVGRRLPGLPRITGLDPAEPYFEDKGPIVRLDPTDALFVDVIHTDGGEFLSGAWGLDLPVGDVDFYPNGGKGQPGCANTWIGSITSIFDSSVTFDDVVDCSHNRAYEFYIESINNPCKFVSYPCRSYDDFAAGGCRDCSNNACSVMGYDVDNNMAALGRHYLSTADTGPYCRYEYKVTIKTKAGMEHTRGDLVVIITGNSQTTAPTQLFGDSNYALDQDTTHTGIVSSTVGIDSIGELRLTYLFTNNILYTWANGADLTIERIDVTSSSGASVSYCGEMLLRDGVMNTISSFNNCDVITQ
ncbi:PNLIPRP3 [Branchiostoma lanceolatum]|uniref:PNLIPRP3 protein n=1 Tax=Branchiostoma lanceolatum TaxID=7740 RepID=A0A8K0E8E7_BRALA|nr:PNLIPRP3 [Branchiostoma lanceolatum]